MLRENNVAICKCYQAPDVQRVYPVDKSLSGRSDEYAGLLTEDFTQLLWR